MTGPADASSHTLKPPGEPTRCQECGAEIRCGAVLGEETCWCDALPPVKPRLDGLTEGTRPSCLCETCLLKRADEQAG